MAQKALESVVRELHKCLPEFTNKIHSLECKINDQNQKIDDQNHKIEELSNMIARQSQQIADFKSAVDGNVRETVALHTQRPIRQARLASVTTANNSAVRKVTNTTRSKQSSVAADAKPMTPEINRLGASNSTTLEPVPKITDKTGPTTKVQEAKTPGICPSQSFKNDGQDKLSPSDGEDWSVVVRNKRISKRKVISGTGKEDVELQTIERTKYIQAWSLKPETTSQNVLNYLKKIDKNANFTVEKRDIKTTKHAAFVIGCSEALYDQIRSPTAWPSRVMISEWFRSRPRVERGLQAECSSSARASISV